MGFRSGYEERQAGILKKAKVPFVYEGEKLKYTVPESTHSYLPDIYLKKSKIYVELKGRFTAAERKKMLNVIRCHPKKDIRMVFMRDNTLSKVSKTTYTMWCAKQGIKCAVGDIPKRWYK